MSDIRVTPLDPDLGFGSRIAGVTREALGDDSIRTRINEVFEARGLIVFEDVEPSGEMQLAISNVFGPLKDHPVGTVSRVDQDRMPGVIELKHDPAKAAIVEIDGQRLSEWLPWHFDHCYNNELNRAGVLRAIEVPADGGLTGFADGRELYEALSPELRSRIDGLNVIYTLDMRFTHMRFGKPETLREITPKKVLYDSLELVKTLPRAIHPAVWTRQTGEKILHVSPWMAVGIEAHEDPEGDRLLTAVCAEIVAKMKPYYHRWKPTDMLVWDNWRLLHCATGCDPKYTRCMHRTTVKGDYGLGYFENGGSGHAILETTV